MRARTRESGIICIYMYIYVYIYMSMYTLATSSFRPHTLVP
jgi:hypothetical protein